MQQGGTLDGKSGADKAREIMNQRASKKPEDADNLLSSVLAELQFIEWPKPRQAAIDTAIVIAIVVGSSGFLFVLNGILTEISKLLFKS